MHRSKIIGAAGLALAAGVLTLTHAACGGGGGGAGIGIATLGVSAIFAGDSPGLILRDPARKDATAAPPSGALSSASVTAEPAITIADGTSVDRIIVAGGLVGSPVVLSGVASATAACTLTVKLTSVSYADFNGPLSLVTRTASIGTAATPFRIVLDFSTVTVGQTETIVGFGTHPGDAVVLTLGASGGDITIDTTQSRVSYVSGQSRATVFDTGIAGDPSTSNRFFCGERFIGDTRDSSTSPAPGAAADISSPEGLVTTGPGIGTLFVADVDDGSPNFTAVPNARVRFTAPGASTVTQTATTNASGEAAVSFSFASLGPTHVLAELLSGTAVVDSTMINVSVEAGATRPWDNLDRQDILADGGSLISDREVAPVAISPLVGGAATGQTSTPTAVEYLFARDVTTGAEWRFSAIVRTRSQVATATATWNVEIDEIDGSATPSVTGTAIATSADETANAGNTLFNLKLTQGRPLDLLSTSANATLGGAIGGFRIVITCVSSSDPLTPGIEVVNGTGAAPVLITAPGPVVFLATATSGGEFLASQPDPRR